MSLWQWVLIGLSAAGVLLVLIALIPVAVAALRLRKRVKTLRNSSLFLSMIGFRIQANHLAHTAQHAGSIAERANAAVASMRESAEEAGIPQARLALEEAGAGITALAEDLR
jgi:hypothetical protein